MPASGLATIRREGDQVVRKLLVAWVSEHRVHDDRGIADHDEMPV
jgi:hypothetical protein